MSDAKRALVVAWLLALALLMLVVPSTPACVGCAVQAFPLALPSLPECGE